MTHSLVPELYKFATRRFQSYTARQTRECFCLASQLYTRNFQSAFCLAALLCVAEGKRSSMEMSSLCAAKPLVAAGRLGGGAARCQPRRSRVRVVPAAAAAAPSTAGTMYEVLAVDQAAGPEEIKAAYRRAARRWHPDACPGGDEHFMRAREAYEVLSDPDRRRGYDIQLRCGGHTGYSAARRAGFADWEAQLADLQWRTAERRASRETWGSRMRGRAAAQPSW